MNVKPIGPATRTGAIGVRAAPLVELARRFWRYLHPGSPPRRPAIDALTDHLLADVGMDGPGYESATWERYIHR
jgi:hypothetical protein